MQILIALISTGILFGLTKSTESVLNSRQRRRDNGEDLKTYL